MPRLPLACEDPAMSGRAGYTASEKWELGLAIAAPLALVPVAILLLVGDWRTSMRCSSDASGAMSCETSSQTLLESGITPAGWLLIAAVVGVLLLVPLLAAADVHLRSAPARFLLRLLAFTMFVFACIGLASIGLFLMPGALLAVGSAAASFGSKRTDATLSAATRF